MNNIWESKDKLIKKEIIERGIFTTKPTDRTSCEIFIEDVTVTPPHFPLEKLNSEYLDDSPEKTIVIGDACSTIDRSIDRAVQMMTLQEKSMVTVLIPATPETEDNEIQITMDITLNNYDPFKPYWEWTANEKYETALKHKEMGTKLFRNGRHVDAFFKFSTACKLLITLEPLNPSEDMDEELVKKVKELRNIAYNNMAECHLHQKNYIYVIQLCTKVLSRDENNIKALYRRGVAYGYERDWEKAFEDMKRVVDMEPTNNAAKERLQLYNKEIKKANKKMDNIMKKMFVAFPDED